MPAPDLTRAAPSAVSTRYFFLLFGPLWERFRRGEGALLAINAVVIAFQRPEPAIAAAQLALSLVVLAALYAFNDLHDAEGDRHDPKKNPALVGGFLERRTELYIGIAALQLALVGAAWALVGERSAATVLAIVAINTAYSVGFKGVPVADIIVVGFWGAIYCAISEPPWPVAILVGAMTSISHIFQILGDRRVDTTNRVRTSAVLSVSGTTAILAVVCAALSALLALELGPLAGISGFVPLVLRLGLSNNEAAWMWSRLYAGAILLVVLGARHGLL